MIIARIIDTKKHDNIIDSLLKQYKNIIGLNLDDYIIYGLEEDNQIIGTCIISIFECYCIINYIFIVQEKRGCNYGEYLLRSVINYCDLKDIKEIYYLSENNYLLKKGFFNIDVKRAPLGIKELSKDKTALVCDVSNFFTECRRS